MKNSSLVNLYSENYKFWEKKLLIIFYAFILSSLIFNWLWFISKNNKKKIFFFWYNDQERKNLMKYFTI